MFKKLKTKFQFQAYCDGYSEGYKCGVVKCQLEKDGRIIPVRASDVSLQSQYCKRPKMNFLYFPWYHGFELGYTECLSWYNSGDNPDVPNNDESLVDIVDRLHAEFDKEVF